MRKATRFFFFLMALLCMAFVVALAGCPQSTMDPSGGAEGGTTNGPGGSTTPAV